MRLPLLLPFAFVFAFVAACRGERTPAGGASPLLVFAASDLRDALAEITRAYRAAGGDSATLVFGSTGELATQIEGGAPADLFFAADAEAVDRLQRAGLVDSSSRAVYAIGRLALIARGDRAIALDELEAAEVRHIAIANPAHAPYGRAARDVLDRIDAAKRLDARLVIANTVSQAEQFVSTGNADAGFVALSLALRRPWKNHVVIDSALHRPLRQTAAVLSGSAQRARATALLAYVQGDEGQRTMRRYGFGKP